MTDTENPYAVDLQLARDGIAALNRNEGEIGELLADIRIEPFALAQMLMNVIPPDGARMGIDLKSYWAAVADHMGPDWIPGLRHCVAFADKVESF